MIITGEDLVKLTNRTQPAAQKRCLAKLGIKPIVRGDGSLAVTESAVTQSMLAAKPKPVEPNFGAIK